MAGNDFDITRDGRQLAYVGVDGGVPRLFLRRLDQFDATPVPGTEGAVGVFFSPDGEWVAFFADGKLQKVDVKRASAAVVLCCATGRMDMGGLNGATWTPDGSIIFATRHQGLQRVAAEGGQPTAVISVPPDSSEIDYHSPDLLPGGQAILFAVHESESRFSIAVQSLGSGQRKVLLESGFAPTYSLSGHIVFARGSAILAVPFDASRLEVIGDPVVLVDNVATRLHNGRGNFRLSKSGSLVFEPWRSLAGRRLTWVDRSGTETPLPLATRSFTPPARISPDGKRLAFAAVDGDRQDIWVYEIATDKLTRITSATEGNNRGPLWTPDGTRLIYGSTREGLQHLVWQLADGSGLAASLASSRNLLWPDAWTPDGRALLYVEQLPTDMPRAYVLHLDPKPWSEPLRQPVVVDLRYPKLSPDGRLVAFGSNATGRVEVYVEPFARTGARLQVSVDGGREPLWSRNGRELFYRRGSQIFAVPVDTRRLTAGKPVLLFERPYVMNRLSGHDYDVTPDGRFLQIRPSAEEQEPPRLNVALNWADELRRRVPKGR
jgi:serine/threonine-protein kinase